MTGSRTWTSARWRVVGESVVGAAHIAAGLPNQDAIAWETREDGRVSVLAVSDGHGSPKCFRSALGASFAVEIALQVLGAFGSDRGVAALPFGRTEQEQLAREVSEGWNRRVDRHLRDHPFTQTEERYVEDTVGSSAFRSVAADPLLAYGTTLLAVLLTPAFALYAQIGDGDILRIDEQGATRRVFPKDPSLGLNETRSLYQLDAWRELRFELVPLHESLPALIAVSTDGYVNSFATDAGFLQVGRDLQAMIRAEGLDAVARALPTILTDASTVGSRDDVTLGIVERVDCEAPT